MSTHIWLLPDTLFYLKLCTSNKKICWVFATMIHILASWASVQTIRPANPYIFSRKIRKKTMITVFTRSIRTPPYHICSKIWTSTIHYPMLCLKIAGWVANSVDPDETPRSAASHLGLNWLLRPVCPNTYGKYGTWYPNMLFGWSPVIDYWSV